jgi:DNA primase
MAEKWINFKELRDRVNVAEILASYNVTVKAKGDQAQGFCPLPTHQAHEGKRKSPSFSINLKRGIFQCFSCHASGNCIDLVCFLEGMDPNVPADIRKAALLLEERYPATGAARISAKSSAKEKQQTHKDDKPTGGQKVIVNAPLDFELKHLDQNHPYLPDRGFTPDTIEQFGLGFCSKGLMKDRIAIPLHDAGGNLIGYAGRVVDDSLIAEENPKYRFPGSRERDRITHEFHKSLFLYNGYRLKGPLDSLAVVEGFASTWWLTQNRHPNVGALMGNSCSPEQAKLIVDLVKPDGRVWFMSDGDEAGILCAKSILEHVSQHRFIRWIRLDDGVQPTGLSPEQLDEVLLSE